MEIITFWQLRKHKTVYKGKNNETHRESKTTKTIKVTGRDTTHNLFLFVFLFYQIISIITMITMLAMMITFTMTKFYNFIVILCESRWKAVCSFVGKCAFSRLLCDNKDVDAKNQIHLYKYFFNWSIKKIKQQLEND